MDLWGRVRGLLWRLLCPSQTFGLDTPAALTRLLLSDVGPLTHSCCVITMKHHNTFTTARVKPLTCTVCTQLEGSGPGFLVMYG